MYKLICATLLSLFLALSCYAQTMDTAILGNVTDSAQEAVPNAIVTITQPSTGLTRVVNTSSSGAYELRYLVPGDYTVEVKAQGFRTERRTGILIQLGQSAKLDFSLQVGSVQQTLEVQSAAPL
jgi:hypothetical protein